MHLNEPNIPAKFMESVDGVGSGNFKILGKLQVPFFDLNGPTRNGRDYSEAAEDALESEDFQERFKTRTVFGRLGHPMTEEECNEDPAVRACVVLTDYKKNLTTNMYEGTLEILDNQYGRQLKSLVDAGCIMGASTRGSGDSYESASGSEVIKRGSYEFEGLDVVTLPAVKTARCRVLESFDKTKRKKLESLIEESNDKYVLESLKITIEASEMPNKSTLIESISKKLSSGVETIEPLVNDITMLTKKLTEAETKLAEAERKLQESQISTGTTEDDTKTVSESTEKLVKLLQSSAKVIESMKSTIQDKDAKYESLLKVSSAAESMIRELKESVESLTSRNSTLESKCIKLERKNKQLVTTNTTLTEKLESVEEKVQFVGKLTESVSASKTSVKSLTESLSAEKKKTSMLEAQNRQLIESCNSYKSKFVESLALANGISTETLKMKVTPNMTIAMIESAAKSIRDSEDARRMALPDVSSLGRLVESKSFSLDDPELDRAGRMAQAINTLK